MNILFCAYDTPGHVATGPNAWLQRLIPDLQKNDSMNISALFIFNGDERQCPTISFFKNKDLPHYMMDKVVLPYIADQVKELLRIIKKNNIDIVVANLVIPAFYATRYLKPFNIPVIGVLHSNDPFYKDVITKFIKGAVGDQLTSVVSVSNYISGMATEEERSILHKIIPCGTPLTNHFAQRTTGTLKIIYAGRLEIAQKQILKLTEAFLNASKNNSNLEFSIYGSGSQEEQVRALIADFQYPHKVHFKGSVSPSEIQDVMLQHHVFTLMSDFEGMPIALMEAMAGGLVPVCLYEESGIGEIISNGVNGFIVKDREDDYQTQLNILQEDKYLWETLSKNAQKTITESYSTAITHAKWTNLLMGYRKNVKKELHIPKVIVLDGDLLYYGDNRKPTDREIFEKQWAQRWLQFKMRIRPRARFRALFRK